MIYKSLMTGENPSDGIRYETSTTAGRADSADSDSDDRAAYVREGALACARFMNATAPTEWFYCEAPHVLLPHSPRASDPTHTET